MNKFAFAFRNNDAGNDNPGNNEWNIPEGAVQVTGFTGEYEKYNGIYLQKEKSGSIDPTYDYPYYYEHEEGICNLRWDVGFSYWGFVGPRGEGIAGCEGSVIGDTPRHPSDYSYKVYDYINSANPVVHA